MLEFFGIMSAKTDDIFWSDTKIVINKLIVMLIYDVQ